jgi:hypothetical protein
MNGSSLVAVGGAVKSFLQWCMQNNWNKHAEQDGFIDVPEELWDSL